MRLLVDGVWRDEQHVERTQGGRFVRPATRFRNWVTEDGSAGPAGEGGFPAARGRYHLYVALACPWAHRTMIMRRSKDSMTWCRCPWSSRSTGRTAGGSAP